MAFGITPRALHSFQFQYDQGHSVDEEGFFDDFVHDFSDKFVGPDRGRDRKKLGRNQG